MRLNEVLLANNLPTLRLRKRKQGLIVANIYHHVKKKAAEAAFFF